MANEVEGVDNLRLVLDELTNAGLVEREGDSYRISDRGRELIELHDPSRLKSAVDSHISYFKDVSLKV